MHSRATTTTSTTAAQQRVVVVVREEEKQRQLPTKRQPRLLFWGADHHGSLVCSRIRGGVDSGGVVGTAAGAASVGNKDHAVVPQTTDGDNLASIPGQVFNLIKSIVGAGVLGLPAGIAAFGDAPSALIPAVTLLCAIGALSAAGFATIGKVCAMTRSTSYRQAWRRSGAGDETSCLPAAACLLVTACTVLTYSMILADTVPALVQQAAALLNIPPRASTSATMIVPRNTALLSVTVLILLPLCLLKQLSSLAPFSLIGILGVAYTALVMVLQWFRGSYRLGTTLAGDSSSTDAAATVAAVAAGGPLLEHVREEFLPRFGNKGWEAVFSGKVAIFISMLSTAFMAHYNTAKFYWELRDPTPRRFGRVVTLSFGGAVLLMGAIMSAGFATFGASCSSVILNNYAASAAADPLLSASRLAVALSLLFSYPLAFQGVREGLLDLCAPHWTPKRRLRWSDTLTVALLTAITALAMVLRDIRIILALGGATWGNCVIYVFPAIMMLCYNENNNDSNSNVVNNAPTTPVSSSSSKQERPVVNNTDYRKTKADVVQAICLGTVGLGLGMVGTTQAIKTFFLSS